MCPTKLWNKIGLRVASPAWLLCALLVPGCAQPTPFAQRNAMIGSLRESVSNLESQKQKLERQVADLSSTNRSLENRLVEEESHGRELAKRLDDARLASSPSRSKPSSSFDDDDFPRRTQPAAQPGDRRAPFAQIRNEIQPLPSTRDRQGGTRNSQKSSEREESDLFPSRDEVGLHGRRSEGDTRWLAAGRATDTDSRRR